MVLGGEGDVSAKWFKGNGGIRCQATEAESTKQRRWLQWEGAGFGGGGGGCQAASAAVGKKIVKEGREGQE